MSRRLIDDDEPLRPAEPLRPEAFAAAMAAFGGFESRPLLAVAVSGGADSMALTLAAQTWAAARGGSVIALTVDHGLRPESAAEAAAVGALLTARGIPHEVLTRTGPKPAAGVEAAARAARYRLLTRRCRELGALHLLTAHHAEDQAETVLLRLGRGSGPDGLAGMPAIRNLGDARLLRPLLGFAPQRLRATCAAAGLPWFADPTNDGAGNARARLRCVPPGPACRGLLLKAAATAALRRRLADGPTADLSARTTTLSPYGFAEIDARALFDADPALSLRVLARLLTTVGGGAYPPARARLARAAARLRAPGVAAFTLAGCLIRRRADGRVLICREAAGLPPPVPPPAPGEEMLWDGRFLLTAPAPLPAGLRLAARGLGGERMPGIPPPAAAALPALWDGDRRAATAQIIVDSADNPADAPLTARFISSAPAAGAAFPVVSPAFDII